MPSGLYFNHAPATAYVTKNRAVCDRFSLVWGILGHWDFAKKEQKVLLTTT